MPQCQVIGCLVGAPSYKGDRYTVHKFPDDEELKKLWLIAIGRENFTPKKHDVICGKHFTEDDYDRSPDDYGRVPKFPRFKKTSIPSKFTKILVSFTVG